VIGKPGLARQNAGHLRRDDVDDIALERLGSRPDRARARIHRMHAAGELRRQPLDHALVVAVPGFLEQILLEEIVLVVQDQYFRFRLVLLEIGRDHRGALIRPGRTAERIGWRGHEEHAAIRHRLQLAAQQNRLRTGHPGMRHDLLRRRIIPLDGAVAECDAWRQNQPVVGQDGSACEPDRAGGSVYADRPVLGYGNAVARGERIVAVGERLEGAQPGEIEVAEEAGRVTLFRFHQGDRECAAASHSQISRRRGAAGATPDDDDFRGGFSRRCGGARQAGGACHAAERAARACPHLPGS